MFAFARFEPKTPAAPMTVGGADIHVWAFMLGESESTVHTWRELLSHDERLRADRFVFDRDRNRWIVARGVVRHLLARYCGVAPIAIAFDYASAGKPAIAPSVAPGAAHVRFNLAHSQDRALLAVARDHEIGVDLERARDDFDPLPIARRFFFGAELAAIHATPAHSRRDAFYRHWVAKEAVLKANGAGLSLSLDSFGVTFDSDGSSARVRSTDPAALDDALVVRMLPLEREWHGAVAASGDGWELRFPA